MALDRWAATIQSRWGPCDRIALGDGPRCAADPPLLNGDELAAGHWSWLFGPSSTHWHVAINDASSN